MPGVHISVLFKKLEELWGIILQLKYFVTQSCLSCNSSFGFSFLEHNQTFYRVSIFRRINLSFFCLPGDEILLLLEGREFDACGHPLAY